MKMMPRVEQFINDALGYNAPMTNCKGYLAPYKPALVMATVNAYGKDMFDKDIKIASIIDEYIKIIEINGDVAKTMKNYEWYANATNTNDAIISNINTMPANKLVRKDNELYRHDSSGKTFRFNSLDYDKNDMMTLLKDASAVVLAKCLREGNLSKLISDMNPMKETELIKMIESIFSRRMNSRPTGEQKKFRDKIMKEYKQCQICGYPHNLEAAHIKPYSISFEEEEFDHFNAIALCSNCHSNYDRGEVSLDFKRVAQCKSLEEALGDAFKLYDIATIRDESLKYTEYHFNNIYKCK